MRGVWLAAIARRITRTDTFESLVAPAVADLQYVAAAGRPVRRHYAALAIVLATALLRDFRIDVQLTFGTPRVWRRTAAWWTLYVLFYVAIVLDADTPWHLLDATAQVTALVDALIGGVMAALPTALIAAVFYLRRESAVPHRTIVVAAVAFVAATIAFQLTAASVRPVASRLLYESASRTLAQHQPGAGIDDRNPYPGHWQTWLETKRDRSTAATMVVGTIGGAAAAFAISSIINLAPRVMFGLVLARGRRWTVFFRVLGLVVTYAFIQVLTMRAQIPMLTGRPPSSDALREIVAMFLTALVWLLGTRVFAIPLLPIYALTQARRLVPRRR
jgi:hypothetical protein